MIAVIKPRQLLIPAEVAPAEGLAEDIWSVVKSFITITNTVMASLRTEGLLPVPLILPSIQTRRAACTHLTMERLYGPYTCSVCHRPSQLFGWLYSCTQDDCHSVPWENGLAQTAGMDEEGIHDHFISDERLKEQPAMATTLNPWSEKAIREGHYTLEQVATLRAQRQNVIDAITIAEEYVHNYPENVSNSLHPQTTTTPRHADPSNSLPTSPTAEIPNSKELEPGSQPKPSMFPFCKMRYCQTCRPTFRDRTWIRFEDVFNKDSPVPTIDFEHDSRPISRADLVRKLGLGEIRRSRPSLRSFEGAKRYSVNLTRQLLPHSLQNRLSASLIGPFESSDEATEPESKGFRDGMKRAFRGMLMHRRRNSTSTRSSLKGKGRWDDVEFDVGLWRDLTDELLQEASSVPLPGHDGMDGLGAEEGEMEVEEGVAVTEEGVDLGTADIIMSV